MSNGQHLGIPFHNGQMTGGGLRCAGCLWRVEIGDSYPFRRRDGGHRRRKLCTLRACWDAFREHYADTVTPAQPMHVRPVPPPIFDWEQHP